MITSGCTFDYWRPFQPVAPELTSETYVGKEIEIEFPSHIAVQGSRDEEMSSPVDPDFTKVPTERGWACSPIIVSNPNNGRAYVSDTGKSIIYKPRNGFYGTDCFNYVLTTGFQQSESGTILVNVTEFYSVYIRIKYLGNNRFTYRAGATVPSTHEGPVLFVCQLYQYGFLVNEDSYGIKRIVRSLVEYENYVLDYRSYSTGKSYMPRIKQNPTSRTLEMVPDTYLPPAYNVGSETLYQPTGNPGDFLIKAVIYPYSAMYKYPYQYLNQDGEWVTYMKDVPQINMSRPIRVEMNITEILGTDWWKSGHILGPYDSI